MLCMNYTPLTKHFDMNKIFKIRWRGRKPAPQSTFLSLTWEITHVHLLLPTPANFKKFVHIEMLGKRCITEKPELFGILTVCKKTVTKQFHKINYEKTSCK